MKTLIVSFAFSAAVFAQGYRAEPLANPSAPGSVQPTWSAAADGSPILSWIEPVTVAPGKPGDYSLRYAVRKGGTWSEARTVIAGRHFFRNPAEAPEVIQLNDKLWMAHWVEM